MLPVSVTAIVLRVIFEFKLVDIVRVVTAGGPGGATDTLSLYIYREGVESSNVGYATAMSMVFLVVVLVSVTALLVVTRPQDSRRGLLGYDSWPRAMSAVSDEHVMVPGRAQGPVVPPCDLPWPPPVDHRLPLPPLLDRDNVNQTARSRPPGSEIPAVGRFSAERQGLVPAALRAGPARELRPAFPEHAGRFPNRGCSARLRLARSPPTAFLVTSTAMARTTTRQIRNFFLSQLILPPAAIALPILLMFVNLGLKDTREGLDPDLHRHEPAHRHLDHV